MRPGTGPTHAPDFRRLEPGPISPTDSGASDPWFSVMDSRLTPEPASASEPAASEPAASVAEDLPELYRTILDRVAQLETHGSRIEADRIRASATRAYSSAWDASAQRVLVGLLSRADRHLLGPSRSSGWSLRRRRAATR